jgi:glucose/arabinose dehydrogenase
VQRLRTVCAALVALVLCGCGGDDRRPDAGGDRTAAGEPRVQTVTRGLDTPWEIAFLPDGRALITERPGRVRVLSDDGELRARPAAEVAVDEIGEGGLLGIALDPDFERNRLIYLYRTLGGENQVVRFRLADDELREERVVVDGIPAAAIHDGGRIRFGPDRRLYVATGDAGSSQLAQDEASPAGKLLRVDVRGLRGDGARPEVHSLGHRNPQGFDWEPGTGRLVASEHGPSANDEINVVERGGNYGWPEVEGSDHGEFSAPLRVYEDQTLAPSGATFVPQGSGAWSGDLLVACLAGEQLRRLRIDGERVTLDQPLLEGRLGRLRTVVAAPDGALYALTSNRDGRGSPRDGDDRVVRIEPPG